MVLAGREEQRGEERRGLRLGQEWGQGTSGVHLPQICSSSPAVRASCDLKQEDADLPQLIAFKKDKSINIKVFNTQHTAQPPSWGAFAAMGWLQCGEQLFLQHLDELGHILDGSLIRGTSVRPGGCRKAVLPPELSVQGITEQMWAPRGCGNGSVCAGCDCCTQNPPRNAFPTFGESEQPQEEACLLSLIEVIQTQPRLWDAVGIRHGSGSTPEDGAWSYQGWELRVRETLGATQDKSDQGQHPGNAGAVSGGFRMDTTERLFPRGMAPGLPELQEHLQNALKDRMGLLGSDSQLV